MTRFFTHGLRRNCHAHSHAETATLFHAVITAINEVARFHEFKPIHTRDSIAFKRICPMGQRVIKTECHIFQLFFLI